MPAPLDVFKYVTADEVAETWDGVGNTDLYNALWNKVVTQMKPIPNLEDSGPHDHIGHENLAKFWHLLTEEEQAKLNNLAIEGDH